jgi:hypothetical protein
MKARIFRGLDGSLAGGGAIVSRKRFARLLRMMRDASRISIAGFATRRTSTGLAFLAPGAGRHPFEVTQLGADPFRVSVAPGLVIVPGTAETFILSEADLEIASAGFLVVRCGLRHRIIAGATVSTNGFTGEAELDAGSEPALDFVAGPTSTHAEPDFGVPSCNFADVTVPIAWIDPDAGRIVPFIRRSLSIAPAQGPDDAWQPDIQISEI